MSKVLKYVLPVAAIAAPFAFPATMAAIGGALGAGVTAAPIVGGGLTSALLSGVGSAASGAPVGKSLLSAALGGVGGALGSGGGQALAKAAGLTGTGANIASGALTGAAYGGASGGGEGALSGALTGGVMGGLGGVGGAAPDSMSGVQTQLGYGGAPMSVPSSLTPLTTGSGLAAGGGASAMNLSDALKLGGSIYSTASSQDAYDQMRKQLEGSLSPYTTAGAGAAGQLSDALSRGFTYEDYANSPAYQFQLGEGQKALQQQLAAQGLSQSGAATKAATDYATNLASQGYGDAYNRWLQQNQQLAGLMGTGAKASGMLGSELSDLTGYGQIGINRLVSDVATSPLTEALLRKSGMFA